MVVTLYLDAGFRPVDLEFPTTLRTLVCLGALGERRASPTVGSCPSRCRRLHCISDSACSWRAPRGGRARGNWGRHRSERPTSWAYAVSERVVAPPPTASVVPAESQAIGAGRESASR